MNEYVEKIKVKHGLSQRVLCSIYKHMHNHDTTGKLEYHKF